MSDLHHVLPKKWGTLLAGNTSLERSFRNWKKLEIGFGLFFARIMFRLHGTLCRKIPTLHNMANFIQDIFIIIVLKDHVSNNLQQTSYLHPNRILQIMAPFLESSATPTAFGKNPNSYQDFQPKTARSFYPIFSLRSILRHVVIATFLCHKPGGMTGWQRRGAMAATISCPKPVSSNWWFRPNPIWKIYVSSSWIISPGDEDRNPWNHHIDWLLMEKKTVFTTHVILFAIGFQKKNTPLVMVFRTMGLRGVSIVSP